MAVYLDQVPFSGIIRIRDLMYSIADPYRLDQGDVSFDAPDTVRALPGGSFHYSWVFTADGVPAKVGVAGWTGLINTSSGDMIPGNCTMLVLPGNQYRFDVSGTLSNPASAGKVQNWIDECENFTYMKYTVILPPRRRWQVALQADGAGADQDPRGQSVQRAVPRSASWGSVKARFRAPRMAPFPS